MIVVTLGNDVNVEQFKKFAWLYRDVINYCNLFQYHIDITYYLPKPQTTINNMTINADKIGISSIILDYAKIQSEDLHFNKVERYMILNMNLIYNKISKAKFDYNFSRNDMLLLNKINRLVKLSK